MNFFSTIAQFIADSPANQLSLYLLRNVPGLPPIVQTLHIISIAAIMGSVVFVALRTLGLAVPSQNPREMVQRLMPWTWGALIVLAASGSMLVVARPFRYFSNPVMGWKMIFLVAALVLSIAMLQGIKRQYPEPAIKSASLPLKLLSLGVVTLWVLVVLSGRWIAYSEYLFAPA
ncbi:hypothetical protein F6455_08690 [Proteobacteria bacterium 005FR1]|nr:hypothetical protein [Proteobacteria bacterium 005FR1]